MIDRANPIFYGVRKFGPRQYYGWVEKMGNTHQEIFPTYNEALKDARRIAELEVKRLAYHAEAILECYKGENMQHFTMPGHFTISNAYRKEVEGDEYTPHLAK